MDATPSGRRVSSMARASRVSSHPRAALRELLRALDARGLGPSARSVAVALWAHADPAGRCWPSQATLVALTGLSERTVRTSLQALERARVLLRDVPRLAERRRVRRTTAYRFTVGDWRSSSSRATGAPRREAPQVEARTAKTSAPVVAPQVEVSEAPTVDGPSVEAPRLEGAELPQVDAVSAPMVEGSPPATTAAPPPATTADRRSKGEKVSAATVAPPRRALPRLAAPPPRRAAPAPSRTPAPPTATAATLAAVLARCSALVAPPRLAAAPGTPSDRPGVVSAADDGGRAPPGRVGAAAG